MPTKVKRRETFSAVVKETITPVGGVAFTYPHTIKIDKTATLAGALVHSGTYTGNVTLNMMSLTHQTGEVRDYSGKKLTRLTVKADAVVSIAGNYLSRTLTLGAGGYLVEPVDRNVAIGSGANTLAITSAGTVTVIMEFLA